MLPNVVSFILMKGGIGRTTGVVNVSSTLAQRVSQAGGRILVIDTGLQGDLIGRLGAIDKTDDGEGLLAAVSSGNPADLYTVTDVRPGLDVIPGGRRLADLNLRISTSTRVGRFLVLEELLEHLHRSYELVVVDTPPNESPLMRAAAATSRWIVSPVTHSPDTRKGLIQMGELITDTNILPSANVRFLGAYLHNPIY